MNNISYIFSSILLVVGFISSAIFMLIGFDCVVDLNTFIGFVFMLINHAFITVCACVTAINIKKHYKGGAN